MIKNYASFDAFELSVIFGEGNVHLDNSIQCNAVSTDSRTIDTGNLFVALKGENFDGHDKIKEAINAGAQAIIVENNWYSDNKDNFDGYHNFISVKDTLDALGQLARFHRDRFNIPVVAIAGSNGKTTTKDITAHILSQKFKTLKTYKNFNNRVGVPLMLLSLDKEYEAAVLELGTNEPGEIALLSKICNPTHGLITNIGKEHLEFLVNLDGVEMEETFLFGYLRGKGGIALINMDDARLAKYEPILDNKLAFGSSDNCGMKATYELDGDLHPTLTVEYEDKSLTASMQVAGIAPAINAIAATAVAFILDIEKDIITAAIETYQNDDDDSYGRMKVIKHNSSVILNDTYNANPSSMMMSLETLNKINTKTTKVAILGDMFELGREAEQEHNSVLEFASTVANEVLLLGENMHGAFSKLQSKNTKIFKSHQEIADYVKSNFDNAAILVKGSRGMKMENVVSKLIN